MTRYALIAVMLLSVPLVAQDESQQQDWALMWKLANDVVAARLEALEKLPETKAYREALTARESIRKMLEGRVPKGYVFDAKDGKVKPAPEQAEKK